MMTINRKMHKTKLDCVWRLAILCVSLLLFPFHLVAQEDDHVMTISGQLLDADLKEPMHLATIQVFWANDSSFVGGTISNERGNFRVEVPSAGTFRLKISSIGYQTLQREVTLRRN